MGWVRRMRLFTTLTVLLLMTSACHSQTMLDKTPAQMYDDPKVVALVEAAIAGDRGGVARAARAGADVNTVSSEGASPLLWTVKMRNLEGMDALLKAGADPWKPLRGTDSVMSETVRSGFVDQLRVMLDNGADPNHPVGDPVDVSLLHIAAFHGPIEAVRLLLAHGADINLHPKGFDSVPGSAIAGGRYDIVLYLLENGYRGNLDDVAGGTQISQVNEEREPDRQKVIAWLKAHGVKYPQFPEEQ